MITEEETQDILNKVNKTWSDKTQIGYSLLTMRDAIKIAYEKAENSHTQSIGETTSKLNANTISDFKDINGSHDDED